METVTESGSDLEERGANWYRRRYPAGKACCQRAAARGYAAGWRSHLGRVARERRLLDRLRAGMGALRQRLEELSHG
jgi:hypothetical protein